MKQSVVNLGDRSVAQLGFGAMRLTGAVLVDTADAYALGLNEELVVDALRPYGDDVLTQVEEFREIVLDADALSLLQAG